MLFRSFLGDQVQYQVEVRGLGDLVARVTGGIDHHDTNLAPGRAVSVSLDERGCLAIETAAMKEAAGDDGSPAG